MAAMIATTTPAYPRFQGLSGPRPRSTRHTPSLTAGWSRSPARAVVVDQSSLRRHIVLRIQAQPRRAHLVGHQPRVQAQRIDAADRDLVRPVWSKNAAAELTVAKLGTALWVPTSGRRSTAARRRVDRLTMVRRSIPSAPGAFDTPGSAGAPGPCVKNTDSLLNRRPPHHPARRALGIVRELLQLAAVDVVV